ncbi:hypothetical protein [Rheinheimera gaetbuli]
MKTLSALTIATLFAVSISAPVSANTIAESLTAVVTNQLSEVSDNIKLQTKQALENTVSELLFNYGSQQAEQAINQSVVQASSSVAVTEQTTEQQQ